MTGPAAARFAKSLEASSPLQFVQDKDKGKGKKKQKKSTKKSSPKAAPAQKAGEPVQRY